MVGDGLPDIAALSADATWEKPERQTTYGRVMKS